MSLSNEKSCERPPAGWRCTRAYAHEGPCAAVPIDPNGCASDCPYCVGAGCDECGGTGERWTHHFAVDGGQAVVHGNAPLTPESKMAIGELLWAAYAKMDALPGEQPR